MYRDLKHKETPPELLTIQNLKLPFLHHHSKINLLNWTSQETYNKCSHIYNTSNLSHIKCGILMRLYFIWTEYGARWYASISSPWVKGSRWSRLLKEHHSGAHCSSVPTPIKHCFIPLVIAHQSTHYNTTYPVIVYSKINCQYIDIVMGGLSVT